MRKKTFCIALLCLLAIPLLLPAMPPLVDLPAHMARFHIAANINESQYLQKYFAFEWGVIGNLGVDLVVSAASSVLDIELATKLVVIAIPVLMGMGMLLVAHEAHGEIPATAPVALIFAYAYPFHYGFVNFCLSTALMFLALALWLRLGRLNRPRLRFLLFLAIAPTIWLAHAIGWGMLVAVCGAAELCRRLSALPDPKRQWLRAMVSTGISCIPLILPIAILMAMTRGNGDFSLSGWLDPFHLAKWALSLNRDRWIVFDLACSAVVVALIGIAIMRFAALRLNPILACASSALLAMFLFAPIAVNGSFYVNVRIAPYAAALAILSIDTRFMDFRKARWLALGSTLFLAVRMAATTASLTLHDRDIQRHLRALEYVQEGSAIVVFNTFACASSLKNWAKPRISHISEYAVSRRNAYTNEQFTEPSLQLLSVKYKEAAHYTVGRSGIFAPKECANVVFPTLAEGLGKVPKQAFDYVWLVGVLPADRVEVPWLKPLYSDEATALYEIR